MTRIQGRQRACFAGKVHDKFGAVCPLHPVPNLPDRTDYEGKEPAIGQARNSIYLTPGNSEKPITKGVA
jgi:hypothetical protein